MRAALLASCAPFFLVACGGGGGGTDPDPDGGVDVPPVPVRVEAEVSPARPVHSPEWPINFFLTAYDESDDPITGIATTITLSPASMGSVIDASQGLVMFSGEGQVTIEGCVDGETEPLCDSVTVYVDAGQPALTITSPAPGAELGGDGAETITVEGQVTDQRAVSVDVNGVTATVEDGSFTATIPARFGVNHIVVTAVDDFAQEARLERDVLFAADFMAPGDAAAPGVSVGDAVLLRLDQDFFDDGAPAEGEVATDLAGIFELLLSSFDVASLLPSDLPIPVTIERVDIGGLQVEVTLVDGGGEIFVRVGNVFVATDGSIPLTDDTSIDLEGGIRASLVAFGSMQIDKPDADSELVVSLDEFTAVLEDAEGEFLDDQANAIFALAEGLLRETLEGLIQDTLGELITDNLPLVLAEAIGALDGALSGISFDLPEPLPPVTLTLDGSIDRMAVRQASDLSAELSLDVAATGEALYPATRGVALSVPAARLEPDPESLCGNGEVDDGEACDDGNLIDFDRCDRSCRLTGVPDAAAFVGVRLALANGLLHTLWNAGLLDIDATELVGDSLGSLVSNPIVSGKLPPVLRPGLPFESHDLILSLGQLQLDATILGDAITYGITLEAGVDLDVQSNVITFDVAETPTVRAWVISSASGDPLVNDEALEGILVSSLWPELRGALVSGLEIALPLPELDLGDFVPGAQPLALELSLDSAPRIEDGVIELRGNVAATVPAPVAPAP